MGRLRNSARNSMRFSLDALTWPGRWSIVMGQLLGGILLVGRMLRHPPPVNAEH